MPTHAYTEAQLVEQPAIGLFAELGWQTTRRALSVAVALACSAAALGAAQLAVTTNSVLALSSLDEALAWTDAETLKLEKAAAGAREKLANFMVPLPRRILLVKTTGQEEAHSAYCRGTNTVVLSRRFVNAPPGELESALIHELFHILSRNHAELRARLYALIGFKPGLGLELPAELESRHITNPDAPGLDFFLEVTRQERTLAVVPVLFATPERWNKKKGGEFFAYLTWKLMAVERAGESWRAARADGQPILLDAREVKGFREQVGEEPGPVLQAEEILAEYFVKLVAGRGQVPPQVLGGMRQLLGP